jgi:hypothetical protein
VADHDRDLRSFRVAARRLRGHAELGLNLLEIVTPERVSDWFSPFRLASLKSVYV